MESADAPPYNDGVPELPEVETIARGLSRRLAGRRILSCSLVSPHLRPAAGLGFRRAVSGRLIAGARRRGKYLCLDLEGGTSLVFHLKMTGQFLLSRQEDGRDRHTHLVLRLDRGDEELRFRDVRKFGRVRLSRETADDEGSMWTGLGPEPLEVGAGEFGRRLARRKGRLKSLLLDQGFVAGIGNIYADEMLFQAGLHPLRPAAGLSVKEARGLWLAMRRVLRRAVARGVSSIRDDVDAEGRVGRFQLEHKVYGRAGEPCRRCGARIRRLVIGGRSSHFCPRCQPSK